MEGEDKSIVATEQTFVADAINEVIGITRHIDKEKNVSQGLKDEGNELARAMLVYGGHVIDELGVGGDEILVKSDAPDVGKQDETDFRDGTMLVAFKGRLIAFGNCFTSELAVDEFVKLLNAVNGVKGCHERIGEFVKNISGGGKTKENGNKIDKERIGKFFESNGYIVQEVFEVRQIDGVFAATITHSKKGVHCKANWDLSSFGLETYSDNVTYDPYMWSKYYQHWSITVFVCDGAKAYGKLMDLIRKADRNMSVLDFIKKADSGKKD